MSFLQSGPESELDHSSSYYRLQQVGKALVAIGFFVGICAWMLQDLADAFCTRQNGESTNS